jgi:hypothetical protein
MYVYLKLTKKVYDKFDYRKVGLGSKGEVSVELQKILSKYEIPLGMQVKVHLLSSYHHIAHGSSELRHLRVHYR